MATLVQQRCRNHVQREAVARCPECAKFFCRECVTEHDGRLICEPCLTALLEQDAAERPKIWGSVIRAFAVAGGFAIAWWVFYILGNALIAIPSEFHDGTAFSDF